ncbi:arginine--tRNA ligase [Candidatus Gracilibacteria bacterium]|nr:arginine--tRNA ligase [Candidatus Gracilibacteria bacterium]
MQHLTTIISSHISNLYGDISFSPALSAPPKPEHGEYCFGVFTLAKPLGKSPNIIAEEIANELRKDTANFTQINTIGGYVNLSCTAGIWLDILNTISHPEMVKPGRGKTVIVDYIGANAGKPLHIGHLCTPSVGQAICNIYNHLGYKVIGDSHFGDWGGIFGKLIWSFKNDGIAAFSTESDKVSYREEFLRNLSISNILELYQSFHLPILGAEDEVIKKQEERESGAREEFKKLSKGDPENVELWKQFTAISISEIEKKLDLLNVHANYNIGESFYEGLNLPRPNNEDYPDLQWNMKDIVAELIKNKVATQNEDGSVGVVFSEESKLPSCILQKKDGTGLYLTSDLAAIKYRLTNGWNPSKIIYSVDVRQQLHLRQAFAIAKMAWPELTEGVEFFHAFNGFIKLKEGAMSTRNGTLIFLEKLIEEGEERTTAVLEEKGRTGDNKLSPEDIQAITVGAIKYSYLSQDREKDVTFDWDKALSFEGNSGPYIQYACVRAGKVAKTENIKPKNIDIQNIELSLYDTALIRTLSEMEMKIQDTASKYKPHTLALYCYDLAVCFNSFYVHTPKILEEGDENLKYLRLELCRLTSEKITLGFSLLGIKMPSEM